MRRLTTVLSAAVAATTLLACSAEPPEGPISAGRCWRDGLRCTNLIVNGGVDPAPAGMAQSEAVAAGYEPFVGPWVYGQVLGEDRLDVPLSAAVLFTPDTSATDTVVARIEAVNDEYNQEFYPRYETGAYTLSLWVFEDSPSMENNYWTVRLKLRDWWNGEPGDDPSSIPPGAYCCYIANRTLTRGFEEPPSTWYTVSWTFSVPLVPEEWDTFEHIDPCLDSSGNPVAPYDSTTVVPGGYAIVITPNDGAPMKAGVLMFDDFVIERIGGP